MATPPPQPPPRRRAPGKFLIISIIVHVLLILLATYLVVQTFAPRKQSFKPGPKPATNQAVEHKIDVVKKQKSMSAPMQMNRIVTKGPSKIVLPEIPTITTDEPTELAEMSGMGGNGNAFSGGSGFGTGGGGGGIQLFGLREKGNGLVGTLYDFKQNSAGNPITVDYIGTIRAFTRGGWGTGMLRKFFAVPDRLTTTQIWIPHINANNAPKAFNAEKYVKPSHWIIVYEGKVRPPSDGRYRFVGQADDVIAVRFNHRDVLDGSLPQWRPVSRWIPTRQDVPPDGARGWVTGEWISLKAAQTYDMQVLIGEFPGGNFNAYLAYEKQGENYSKAADGSLVRPVFRLRGGPLPPGAPAALDGPVWTSVASGPEVDAKP